MKSLEQHIAEQVTTVDWAALDAGKVVLSIGNAEALRKLSTKTATSTKNRWRNGPVKALTRVEINEEYPQSLLDSWTPPYHTWIQGQGWVGPKANPELEDLIYSMKISGWETIIRDQAEGYYAGGDISVGTYPVGGLIEWDPSQQND